MKRIAWLFLVVLGSAILMHAQSSTKSTEMSGTICQSSCVSHVDNLATCDKNCTDKSGEAVLVDDQGILHPIANQDMCRSHMGKHVKMTAVPTEGQRERELRIEDIENDSGAG